MYVPAIRKGNLQFGKLARDFEFAGYATCTRGCPGLSRADFATFWFRVLPCAARMLHPISGIFRHQIFLKFRILATTGGLWGCVPQYHLESDLGIKRFRQFSREGIVDSDLGVLRALLLMTAGVLMNLDVLESRGVLFRTSATLRVADRAWQQLELLGCALIARVLWLVHTAPVRPRLSCAIRAGFPELLKTWWYLIFSYPKKW